MSFAIYTGYTVTAPAPVSMSTHPICNPQHGGDGWMGAVRGEWRTECGEGNWLQSFCHYFDTQSY